MISLERGDCTYMIYLEIVDGTYMISFERGDSTYLFTMISLERGDSTYRIALEMGDTFYMISLGERRQYLHDLFKAVLTWSLESSTYMISLERGEPWPAGPRLRLLLSCARLSAAQN